MAKDLHNVVHVCLSLISGPLDCKPITPPIASYCQQFKYIYTYIPLIGAFGNNV
jgi:hypothetical protein